jgi:hypothetical protein
MAFSTKLTGISVNIGGTTTAIAAVGSIEFTNERAALEVTELGQDFRSYIAGISNATASLTLYYDQASTAHTHLEGLIASPSAQTFILTLNTGMTYSFSGLVTSFAITAQAGEVVQATVQLQVNSVVVIA